MARQEISPQFKQDEFSKIFDEYRAKIEEITRKTEKSLNLVGTDLIEDITVEKKDKPYANGVQPVGSDNTSEKPNLKAAAISPQIADNSKDRKTGIEVERQYMEQSAEIISEAKRKAKHIVEEAEETVKKEAKKKTQSQVEKIIDRAKKEAEEIIAAANEAAEKQRDEVIITSKREAERLIKEITETCRQETQGQAKRTLTEAETQSAQIIAEAQEYAGKLLTDISASTTIIGRFIEDIVTRAKTTVKEFEVKLQQDTAELTRVVTETQSKLEGVNKTTREEKPASVPIPDNKIKDSANSPALIVRVLGERSNGKNGTQPLFGGQVEMKSASMNFDYQYLKNLKKHLMHLPGIKCLQEYASEKEMAILFDFSEPLPLLQILRDFPQVDAVANQANDTYSVIFKNHGN